MEKYGSIHVARLTVAIYSILYRLYSRKKYGRTGCPRLQRLTAELFGWSAASAITITKWSKNNGGID